MSKRLDCEELAVEFGPYKFKKHEINYCPFHYLNRKYHQELAFSIPPESKWISEDCKKQLQNCNVKNINNFIINNYDFHPEKMIFMGMGAWSTTFVNLMLEKLIDAYSHLGGRQQPPDPFIPFDCKLEEKLNLETENKLRSTLQDIAISFGLKCQIQ